MKIGLSGAHRTGKTTLAKALAEELGIEYLDASISGVYNKLGILPTDDLSFSERFEIQLELINHLSGLYANRHSFVTDRTPLDLIGYMMLELNTYTVKHDGFPICGAIPDYIERCQRMCRGFDKIFLVRPGIKVVEDCTKASCYEGIISEVDLLICGAAADDHLYQIVHQIPKRCISLESRLRLVLCEVKK